MSGYSWQRDGNVAHLVLERPPLNTFTVDFMTAITRDVQGFAAEPPRAIVIRSAIAGVFSHGVDPGAILGTDLAGRQQVFRSLGEMIAAFRFSGIPVVCDVGGPAFAGGAVLATLADVTLVEGDKGRIAFSEVKVGLPLPSFVQALVKAKVVPGAWTDVMLLGRNFTGDEALKVGLAQGVYRNDGERQELLQGYVDRILRLPHATLAETLRAGRLEERRTFEDFRSDLGTFSDFLSDDFLGKGLAAVVQGKSPQF